LSDAQLAIALLKVGQLDLYSIHINILLLNDMSIQFQKLSLKAKLFRGLGDPTRLSILESLRSGEKTTSMIAEEIGQGQPNVSNHLSCLLDCGLVQNRRNGKNIFYSIRNKKVATLLQDSDLILSDIARGIYECVNYNLDSKV
jgi:DNA-binding transcriptional ArsR family regulator